MSTLQKSFPRGDGVFVQDSAPAHTAGRTLDWLEERGIELEDHPPQSPDINRIEVRTFDFRYSLFQFTECTIPGTLGVREEENRGRLSAEDSDRAHECCVRYLEEVRYPS